MPAKLTDIQKDTIEFITNEVKESYLPPTIAEVAKKFSITNNAAAQRMEALVRKGFLMNPNGKSRGHIPTNLL